MNSLWLLFFLLVASTYLPLLSGLNTIIGIGLSSTILLASTPIWLKVFKNRSRGEISIGVVAGVFSLFMIVRFIEVIFLWGQPLYMVEKAWGFLLLIIVIYYYGGSGEAYGFVFKPRLHGVVDYSFLFIVLGASTWAIIASIQGFIGLSELFSPIIVSSLFLLVLVLYLVVNSLFEELLFRGITYSVLSSSLGLVLGGFLVQSVLFGLWHIPHHILYFNSYNCLFHIGFATVFGLVATVYRRFHDSLSIPILMHTVVNFLGFSSASTNPPMITLGGVEISVQETYLAIIILSTIAYTITRHLTHKEK